MAADMQTDKLKSLALLGCEEMSGLERDWDRITELVSKVYKEYRLVSVERMGGLTNRTYHVTVKIPNDGERKELAVRLPGMGTEEMIDRADEKKSTQLAFMLGIEPHLFWFDAVTGEKVSAFICEAATMHPADLRTRENILRVAQTFRKLHSCGQNTGVDFNPVQIAQTYENVILRNEGELFEGYAEIKTFVNSLNEKYFSRVEKVPCHNDALCENWMLQKNGTMFLIDWEYAGMNDPMWDLADVSIEAELTPEMEELLMEAYLGHKAEKADWWRMSTNKIMIDYLWSLWGKARAVFEGPELEKYALVRWNRMLENMKKSGRRKLCIQGCQPGSCGRWIR